jgi:hypothetical protein
MSRRALQIVIFTLSLLPLTFGTLGVVFGVARFDAGAHAVNVNLDSQFRFLSAWYLGLAALAWWIALEIEKHTALFRILCLSVFAGGLARLLSLATAGVPETRFLVVLAAELLVFPVLMLWQGRVAAAAKA